MAFFLAQFCDNILNVTNGVKKLAAVFSKQNEGLNKQERESRLLALEKIASSVRARRSRPEEPHSTLATSRKARIHA